MAYTLLEVTQAVLSSMDGDEVSSITETPEAEQVALAAKTVYLDIIARADLPEHFTLQNLTETSSSTPVVMTVPTDVSEVLWVKYDRHPSTDSDLLMQPIYFKPLDEFLNDVFGLDESDTTVDSMTLTIGSSSIELLYKNNQPPSFYTSYNDTTLLFDSVDTSVETFLRATKSQAYVRTIPSFTFSGSFTPDLDEPQMQLWLNETKALCWAEYRQVQHVKAEVNAKRGWNRLQKTKFATEQPNPLDRIPNYGRK